MDLRYHTQRDHQVHIRLKIFDNSGLAWYSSTIMLAIPYLNEIVRTRRSDMGISQTLLAKLSGLSRVTVTQIESGTIKDLSVGRTMRLLSELGLSLHLSPARGREKALKPTMSAVEQAALSASVSYRSRLSPETLARAVVTGEIPEGFEPHMNAFLDDASAALLANVVEQVHLQSSLPRSLIWSNMRALAASLGNKRPLWK
ncbi:helix-turn-helix domain-containing protein [Paucibacter soli]|uniref:helix-turn-helix domain-containing protein n=1 Tax=Paucibacter soli TaxID=3133433 RepID=UPI003097D9D8